MHEPPAFTVGEDVGGVPVGAAVVGGSRWSACSWRTRRKSRSRLSCWEWRWQALRAPVGSYSASFAICNSLALLFCEKGAVERGAPPRFPHTRGLTKLLAFSHCCPLSAAYRERSWRTRRWRFSRFFRRETCGSLCLAYNALNSRKHVALTILFRSALCLCVCRTADKWRRGLGWSCSRECSCGSCLACAVFNDARRAKRFPLTLYQSQFRTTFFNR